MLILEAHQFQGANLARRGRRNVRLEGRLPQLTRHAVQHSATLPLAVCALHHTFMLCLTLCVIVMVVIVCLTRGPWHRVCAVLQLPAGQDVRCLSLSYKLLRNSRLDMHRLYFTSWLITAELLHQKNVQRSAERSATLKLTAARRARLSASAGRFADCAASRITPLVMPPNPCSRTLNS